MVIRYTPMWLYALVIGVLSMLLLSLFGGKAEISLLLQQMIFWSFIGLFAVYFVVSRSIRREILQAIRERRLSVTGSRFNPRRPLTLTITKS